MQSLKINNVVLLILVFLISMVFLVMIRPFFTALLLAGIFAAMAQPVYRKFNRLLGRRRRIASLLTLLLFVLVVLLPLSLLIGVITAQAVRVAQSITPWVQRQMQPGVLSEYLQDLPYYKQVAPYREEILNKAGEIFSTLVLFLVDNLQAGAISTVYFIFMFFIFLYAAYFFLIDGGYLLKRIMYYLPLQARNEERLLERFTSVTRATLKGTLIIGALQGSLAGLAFAVVGIEAAIFWATIMTLLSIIPAVGSGLVWLPAAIFLALGGEYLRAIGLALFCGIVVGSLDNLLRPRLVGKDTQMHDLLIFLSTLGGLSLFGLIGFVIGPIVAALFVTIWELYGEAFKDILPDLSRDLTTQPSEKINDDDGHKDSSD
jgi:predicted PurR-regulated permease PerM